MEKKLMILFCAKFAEVSKNFNVMQFVGSVNSYKFLQRSAESACFLLSDSLIKNYEINLKNLGTAISYKLRQIIGDEILEKDYVEVVSPMQPHMERLRIFLNDPRPIRIDFSSNRLNLSNSFELLRNQIVGKF